MDKREVKIITNKNAFNTDMINYKRKYSNEIENINNYLLEYGYDRKELLENPASKFAINVMNLNEQLSSKGIEYFASKFTLRNIYEKQLIKIADSSVYVLEDLIKKLNKINKLSTNPQGNAFRNVLLYTGLAKLYISKEVEQYKEILVNLENYSLKDNLEELMILKYSEENKISNVLLAYQIDTHILKKAGLGLELEKCEDNIKPVIFKAFMKEKVKTK